MNHHSKAGKASVKKRFSGKTKGEISAMMSAVSKVEFSKMTKKERSEYARKLALKRWGKKASK